MTQFMNKNSKKLLKKSYITKKTIILANIKNDFQTIK